MALRISWGCCAWCSDHSPTDVWDSSGELPTCKHISAFQRLQSSVEEEKLELCVTRNRHDVKKGIILHITIQGKINFFKTLVGKIKVHFSKLTSLLSAYKYNTITLSKLIIFKFSFKPRNILPVYERPLSWWIVWMEKIKHF